MSIPQEVLESMNSMLENGSTIADIWREYKLKYDYNDIKYSTLHSSILGAKRRISNRLTKLNSGLSESDRGKAIDEIRKDLAYLYRLTKINGKKLATISKVIEKE